MKTTDNLRELTRYYALGKSDDTSFSDADTLLNLNARYQEAFLMATANDGDFEFNGDGSENISITSGTRSYTRATDLFKVLRVEIKYPSSSENWQEAHQINSNQIQRSGKDNYTAGRPEFDVVGREIEIFVSAKTADIEAVSNGIKVYYQKELTELAADDSEIIFPDVFARYICLGAAMDYCLVNGLKNKLAQLEKEYLKMETKLTLYISNRNKAKRHRITFGKEDYSTGDGGYAVSDQRAF